MDATATASKVRPTFERSEISDRFHWILDEIQDLSADALASACDYCGASFSWGQWLTSAGEDSNFHCHSCSKAVHPHDSTQDPSEALVSELRSPGYFDRIWYHATIQKDWLQAVQEAADGELLVHAGDRLTALGRADYLRHAHSQSYRSSEPLPIYLHSFRLRVTEGFAPEILEDSSDDWPEDLSDHFFGMQVLVGEGPLNISDSFIGAPYYNRYEAPGTISLILGAKFIDGDSLSTELLRD